MPVEVTRRKVPQRTDRRLRSVRVKRCGKSAPAPLATGVARQTPPGARSRRERAVRPQTLPGRPHRWMVIHGPTRRSRTEPRLQVDSPPPPTKALSGPLRSGGRDRRVQANACHRSEWLRIVAYGDGMFTTIVVWVVGLTIGYVGLRAIRTRSWSGSDRSED